MKTLLISVALCCVALAVLCGCADGPSPAGAYAGASYMGLDGWDVVVATVREVSAHAASHGNPPRVVLAVHEVLRGDPKADRGRAIWAPPPHDVDYGPVETNPRYVAWSKTPMAGPTVGDKMILWGRMAPDKGGKAFRTISWARFPYSKAKRAWAVALIKKHAEQKRAREAKLRTDKTALAEAKARWRAEVSDEAIGRYAGEADFVGIGRITGEGYGSRRETRVDFHITEILKGAKRKSSWGKSYYARTLVPQPRHALLDRQTDYLLFLSESGMELNPGVPSYPRIRSGDGIVIADGAAVKAAREAIEKAPKAAPRPVLVLSVTGSLYDAANYHTYRRGISSHFEEAAAGRWTVLRANLFTPGIGAETAARHTRRLVPGANALLLAHFPTPKGGKGPPRTLSVAIVRLARDRDVIVLKEDWTLAGDDAVRRRAAEALKKLAGAE